MQNESASFKNSVSTHFAESPSVNQKPNMSYCRKKKKIKWIKNCFGPHVFPGRNANSLQDIAFIFWIIGKSWYWVRFTIKVTLFWCFVLKKKKLGRDWNGPNRGASPSFKQKQVEILSGGEHPDSITEENVTASEKTNRKKYQIFTTKT